MGPLVFSEESLDDLLNRILTSLLESGDDITPGQGACREHFGVLIELRNPRARLSRSEGKGKLFSSLGETCWYLSGSDSTSAIKYYIHDYPATDAEHARIFSAYGPRLFGTGTGSQIENVIKVLTKGPDSRRAVVQIYSAADLEQAATWNRESKEPQVPCTCVLQFAVRRKQLNVATYMRSNDVFIGFPHDIFAFTMMQEIVASRLGVEIGSYRHAVGSLHLYEKHFERARTYLGEGWQHSAPMPPMPAENVTHCLASLLRYEEALRRGSLEEPHTDMPPYWRDLAWILFAFAKTKTTSAAAAADALAEIRAKMSNDVFDVHLADRMAQLKAKPQ